MQIITLDCTDIREKGSFHAAVSKALSFADYYGKNLDALHDCLTDIFVDTQIRFEHWNTLREALGLYSAAIQWAMTHAADKNPCVQVFFD